ncbi:uncharacterized protein LOC125053654 isoform X3 [Pieris napi]|uniref:uncharacterized protein LOC125053654 isoform X3 n=2 Tax=Pieris napi TaxID=78633 RepID=UPI001FBAF5EC|nr:uncharacterized protein LOC125053654 isoform X3 [Pieris napi]
MAAAPASCMNTENGCVMFDCLVHLWEWIDPPLQQTQFQMDAKKTIPAQQPLTHQHIMAHHVHPDQIYTQQQMSNHVTSNPPIQNQPNGVTHQQQQLIQNQYHATMTARSPLLENRHEIYGTSHNHEYARHYGANDNYNYQQQQSPTTERTEQIIHTDHNVNHDIVHNIPKGYNAEVYQDYLKRNPPKDSNQIYQNHQPMYRPNMNQYGSKPYLPYSNRIGPQSNTELLRRQYNEIQQLKMQQQLHYQNQAQMHQQQKFAERQLLLQQIHGVQPPPNLQNSIYSDSSYRDLDRYGSRNDFKEYTGDIQKDVDKYAKNNEYREIERQNKQFQEAQWQQNQEGFKEIERYRSPPEDEKTKHRSPPTDFNNQLKRNTGTMSPMKSSESSSPSVKSPSTESRRSSSGQALRSPTAQRIPSAPVTISGMLYKQGSDGLKVWRKRWFVLSEYCLFYYKSQDEEKLLGSVLLPSYKVSACTSEDKVMRKYAFKLEHANMRTYVLAAMDQESMMKWVKGLTMAALMQNYSEHQRKQIERTAKPEDDDIPGPTYANAPPKPRRSNDGYNSPGSDIYDPNYDLLIKPESQYNQSTSKQYQDQYGSKANQESYARTPQSPPQPPLYQTKRSNDLHNSGSNHERPQELYKFPQSPPFETRRLPDENMYQTQNNPFLQNYSGQETRIPLETQNTDQKSIKSYGDNYPETKTRNDNAHARDVYGELKDLKPVPTNSVNDRIMERRTPDAYGRSTTMSSYKNKLGDYEDVYSPYSSENPAKSPNLSLHRDNISLSSQKQQQKPNQTQEKVFSGPSVLRRKKMQASGIQPPMPRPHSADFLEYEARNESLNKTMPTRNNLDPHKNPQRPKSSLDINSYYDPSSETYYSEESYAEKMRQSAQYLQQQGLAPRNIQIPLAKYASGLAEKQLQSPYAHTPNNNYETEFGAKQRDNISYTSKYSDLEGLNSNWMLKEKDLEQQKDYLNRSGSVMSDGSNGSYLKEASKLEPNSDGFIRSASARLPTTERDGEKKVQQREESMKRLLEWKQRMLQSPLTRKSTPATISLARSLNQSRQSLRSDQYKPKTYSNNSYNSYSSDDEASLTISGTNIESNANNNQIQQTLSKKSFVGSNTSIGRSNRDGNIPVRAVSPRVRWVEDKANEHYTSQQISASQHNLNILPGTEESWATIRSPSRMSQQPVSAVSPRVRRNTETDEMQKVPRELVDIPTAGELLGRSHEELVLLLIQLRRRHAAIHRSIEQCCHQINSIEECLSSLKALEREESLRRLEQLKMQLMELEQQYAKSKPLVQLVDNMVKLGSLYNKPGSTIERLERNQRLRHKVLAEHAVEQQRWLESAAAGKPLETEAARARVAELWALEQELADEASILQGLKTDKDAIESLLSGVRSKLDTVNLEDPLHGGGLEVELARVHAMLAHNSKVYKKLEQTVAENARLERELQQLRRALRARRAAPQPTHSHPTQPAQPTHPTAMLEDEVTRVQQLVTALQRQRQELSRAVRHLTQQSQVLQTTQDSMPGQHRPLSYWQETNLDTGHTIDHGQDYEYESHPIHYGQTEPLYVDTRPGDITSPMTSEDMQHSAFGHLSNVEKQEIKTVRIVKRESERRQRDRERSLQPMSDWSTNITTNIDQFLEEELVQPINNYRASSVPRTDYSKFEEYYAKQNKETPYLKFERNMELSPKYPSSPSLSNYDYSRDYKYSYDRLTLSNQYLNSPTESSRTLTNDISKTSSVMSLTRSNMELSPIFKSEAAKEIITEMSDTHKNGSLHRRQVPKEKRRHYTAPHHLSAKTLNELPKNGYKQDAMARSVDDADMERALRGAAPDVVRSALPATKIRDSIDQLLAAPQKIVIPERYIPEKPPELSPEEQQKRQEKVESIKKMLSSSSGDQTSTKSPDGEKRQREHLLQMNQILAKQVTEMSKIIAVKALEELPLTNNADDSDRSPDVELPIYQQRDNFFT